MSLSKTMWLGIIGSLCAASTLLAAPYASNVVVSGTTVTFILNEPADSLTYTINGGGPVALDGTTKGSKTFNLGATTDDFAIIAEKDSATGYTISTGATVAADVNGFSQVTTKGGLNQTSDDTNNFCKYNSPRGVDVNPNVQSPNFGTAYISNSAAGGTAPARTGRGLFAIRADQTDAFAYGFAAKGDSIFGPGGSANTPFRISMDSNGDVYVSGFGDALSGVWHMLSDISNTPDQIFSGTTGPSSLPPGQNHGSTTANYIEGTWANSNLIVYTLDEDLTTLQVTGAGSNSDQNSLWKYTVGTTVPYSTMPTKVNSGSPVLIPAATTDVVRGANGKWYLAQFRSAGTEPGIIVLDSAGVAIYDTLSTSRTLLGDPTAVDIIRNIQGVAVTADQKWIVCVLNNSDVAAIPLDVNGIPDIASRLDVDTGTNVNSGRDIAIDPANNIHYVSSGQGLYRVLAPGGHNKATISRTGGTYAFTNQLLPTTFLHMTVQPQGQFVCQASPPVSVQFTAAAEGGTLPYTYQWQKDNVNVSGGDFSGGTTATLTVSNVVNNLGVYKVIITDSSGSPQSVTSNNASLALYGVPTFSNPPPNRTVRGGDNTTISATAVTHAVPSTAPTYQWYKGTPPSGTALTNGTTASGTVISGVATATLTLNNIHSDLAGTLYVRATDGCGRFADGSVKLTVVSRICNDPFADADGNGLTDMNDFAAWQLCYTGSSPLLNTAFCACFDRENNGAGNGIVDSTDLTAFEACAGAPPFGGHPLPVVSGCDGPGGVLYSETFDADHTTSWVATVGGAPGPSNDANFFFDYSTVGIPASPNLNGLNPTSSTRGLRMRADFGTAIATLTGISASPLDAPAGSQMSFTGNYTLEFNAWMNFVTPAGTANGTTQYTNAGILASGTAAEYIGAVTGIMFCMTGDGGSVGDYRAFTPNTLAAGGYLDTANTVYASNLPTASGIRDSGHVYYNFMGGAAAPAAQLGLFATQTGVTPTGAAGFAWRDVKVIRSGNTVYWTVDGRLMATVDITGEATGGTNIFLGQCDSNATVSTAANQATLNFGLFDNVSVTRN